jgi:hypothetical protein
MAAGEVKIKCVLDMEQVVSDAKKIPEIFNNQVKMSKWTNKGVTWDLTTNALTKGVNDATKAMDWFDAAVKRATISAAKLNAIKGLSEVGGKDLNKVLSMGSFNENVIDKIKGLREAGGSDLAKVLSMGSFNEAMGEGMRRHATKYSAILPKASFMDDPGFFTRKDVHGKMQGPDLSGVMRENEANRIIIIGDSLRRKQQADQASFYKNMSLLVGPVMNPGSPMTTMFAGRQAFSALMTQTGQGAIGRFGLSGVGGAAIGSVALTAGSTALGAAFLALKKSISEMISTIDKAKNFYAKSIMSGMGMGFTVKRSMLSEILGVSEIDVVRFGNSVGYVSKRTDEASRTIANATPRLTMLSWEFGILGKEVTALFTKMMHEAAPGLILFARALDGIINVISNNKWLFQMAMWATGMAPIAIGAHVSEKMMGRGAGYDAPMTTSSIKQLPASSWEHMGLVMGAGIANTTNDLIKKSNAHLREINDILKMIQGGGGGGSFGLSPLTSNP